MVVWVYMLVLGTEPEWGLLFLAATNWSCIGRDNLMYLEKCGYKPGWSFDI